MVAERATTFVWVPHMQHTTHMQHAACHEHPVCASYCCAIPTVYTRWLSAARQVGQLVSYPKKAQEDFLLVVAELASKLAATDI